LNDSAEQRSEEGGMNIHINPSGVHAVGSDLDSLSASAAAVAGHSLDASNDAARAHAGWVSAPAVQSCAQAWSRHLTGLVGAVSATAQKLHDSATTTQLADEEAARRLRDVLNELTF
jgi:uncharacterized protein YukE